MSQSSKSSCMKIGCGCGATVLVLGLVAATAGMVFAPQIRQRFEQGVRTVKERIAEMPVYEAALKRAEADPRVQEKLGTQLAGSIPQSIDIEAGTDGARTSLEFDVTGLLGRGRIKAVGHQRGQVEFERLVIVIDGQEIDLLEDPAPAPSEDGD